MFKPGSIRKIQVKNFVTYSYSELYPGPNLNMLIGPNGTGKSTMVAAIILGLGGNPKVVGRGTKISEYVKHSCTEATIDLFLQDTEENRYIHITRHFDTQEKNTWKLNNRKVILKDIIECTKQFNIQVDNLCQFLPQDRVADFAKLNKKELLRETQVALCRNDLIEKQDALIESRSRHKQLVSAIEKSEQKLHDAQDANVRLDGKVDNFRKKKKYLERVDHIDRKMAWVQYEEAREKLDAKKEDKNKATQIYEKYKNAAKPMEQKINTAKKQISDLQAVGTNITRATRSAENEIRQKIEKCEDVRKSVNDIIDQMNSKLAEIQQSEQEIEASSAKVEEMRQLQRELVNKCGNDEIVRNKVGKIMEEVKKLTRCLQAWEAKKESVVETKQNYSAQLRALHNEINRLENVKQQRLEKLHRMDSNVYEAVLWLRENKHLFKGEVFEPIMMELNVLEPRNAIYVENVIARRDRLAFTCVEKEDMNLLIKCLREQKNLRISVLHSGNTGEGVQDFQPRIPIEQLRRYGFYTYVYSLFSAPDPIMRYLCRTYGIHNIPVGDHTTNNCFDRVPNDIRLFFSDKFRFSVSYSRYTSEKSLRQNEIHSDGTLSVSVDVFRLESLAGQIEDMKKNCEACDRQVQEYDNQIIKVNETVSGLREELKSMQAIKQKAEQIEGRIRAMQQRITEMRLNIRSKETVKQEANKKIKKVMKDMEKAQHELARSFKHYSSLLPKAALNTLKVDVACKDLNHLENKAVEARQACQEAEEILNRVKDEFATVLAQAKAALNKAKSLSAGFTPDDTGFEQFREEYNNLSTDLRILQTQKDQYLARIDCLNTADDSELKEYEERAQLIENLQKDIEKFNTEMNKITLKMNKLQDEWLVPLRELVAEISYRFSSSFERMGCAGEISIDTGDNDRDYSEYGLSVKVTFRNGEPLQQLNTVVQSGGERAVATAVFMLSLQELTPVPFRCVDEINQGMDANNERRIFDLLVSCTTRPDTSQYFLITPKLVPNLNYVGGMMIHIVHNGPFVVEDRKWTMSRLCNPQRVQIH